MEKTLYYPGLDFLKFLLCLLIVSIHTCLLQSIPVAGIMVRNLDRCAVPTFFAISAFLFCNKTQMNHTCSDKKMKWMIVRRLLILYMIWEVLLFPITKLEFYDIATYKEQLFAIFFSQTFSGSWFIKALIYCYIVYFIFPKSHCVILTVLFSILYLILDFNKDVFFTHCKFNPYFTFIYHLWAFYAGIIISKYKKIFGFATNRNIAIYVFAIVYFLSFFPYMEPFSRILYPYVLIPLFISFNNLSETKVKVLRKSSILIFILHFIVIRIMKYFDLFHGHGWTDSISLYIFVLTITLMLSLLIVWSERKIPTLKYLH